MNEIVVALIGAGGTIVGVLLGLFLGHRNAVSKTVQDKLHLDRADVIKHLFASLVYMEECLDIFIDYPEGDNLKDFNDAFDEYLKLLNRNTILLDPETEFLVRNLEKRLLQSTFLISKMEVSEVQNRKDSITELLNYIDEAKLKLDKNFSNLMGVNR
jgi:hypothetical protein